MVEEEPLKLGQDTTMPKPQDAGIVPSQPLPTAATTITKVDTTVSVLSPTTFGASRKLPYRTTLPLSTSLPLRHLDQADSGGTKKCPLERSESTNAAATTVVENPMATSSEKGKM